MIHYAVMTFMYDGWANSEAGSHEKLIDILAESGAQGMEAFANRFIDNCALLDLYRRELSATGLAMPVMDAIANLAVADKKARTESYDVLRRCIDVCDAFDSEIVHLAGCMLVPGVTPEDGRKLIAEGLADFVDDVEKRGMTLAFEDFNPAPTLICGGKDCLDILQRTDERVKFVFDTGNFEDAGEHAPENFDLLIDRTCHFHFKDFALNESPECHCGTYFGQGMVNNGEIANRIKSCGYSGWVALESYPQDGLGPVETVPTELATLRALFDAKEQPEPEKTFEQNCCDKEIRN